MAYEQKSAYSATSGTSGKSADSAYSLDALAYSATSTGKMPYGQATQSAEAFQYGMLLGIGYAMGMMDAKGYGAKGAAGAGNQGGCSCGSCPVHSKMGGLEKSAFGSVPYIGNKGGQAGQGSYGKNAPVYNVAKPAGKGASSAAY